MRGFKPSRVQIPHRDAGQRKGLGLPSKAFEFGAATGDSGPDVISRLGPGHNSQATMTGISQAFLLCRAFGGIVCVQ